MDNDYGDSMMLPSTSPGRYFSNAGNKAQYHKEMAQKTGKAASHARFLVELMSPFASRAGT